MGSVYLARHPRLDKQTALKLLNRDLFADASVRARFEREADLAAQLDHPSIVAVYDRGTEADQQWISMQYIDGADASSVTALTLPPERAVQIIEGVADALDYAHGIGVLHRDVKPGNILLARSSAGHGERVFLTDFGLARLRAQTTQLTQQGMFTATLAFASPEQMTGSELDGRSDQYSLACTLYWLLTGMAPFDSPNPADIIHGNLQLAAPPLAVKRRGLPLSLDAVLAVAMAKHPSQRFGTCVEFAAAARHALSNPGYQPVPARSAPPAAYPPPVAGYPAAPPMPQYPPAVPPAPVAPPAYPAQRGIPEQAVPVGGSAGLPAQPGAQSAYPAQQGVLGEQVGPAAPAPQPGYPMQQGVADQAVQVAAPAGRPAQPGGHSAYPGQQGVPGEQAAPADGSVAPETYRGAGGPGAEPQPIGSTALGASEQPPGGASVAGQQSDSPPGKVSATDSASPSGSVAQQAGGVGSASASDTAVGSGNSGDAGANEATRGSERSGGPGHSGEPGRSGEPRGAGDAVDDGSEHPTTVTAYAGAQGGSSLLLKGEPAPPAPADSATGAPAMAATHGGQQPPPHNGVSGFGAAVPPYGPNHDPGHRLPGKRGTSPALIAVFTIIGLLVVLLVLAVVVFVVGGDDGEDSGAAEGPASTFTPAKDITPQEDPVERSRRVFPSLLPQGTADSGAGYQGAQCTAYEPDDPVRIEDRALSSRPWEAVWECRRRVESDSHMDYTIVVYEDADDARAVLGELPPNSRGTGVKSGAPYTTYHWIEPDPPGPLTTTHLVVGFGGSDPIRSNALISVRHSGPIADEFGRLSSENAVLQWWADAPL
ncbi:hypothetical protein FEK35_26395 [Nocardia cyriacigeorgica]|uniref:non-specific serine/threonine protein kinase n=2 Tax=Nocardia cyriacigeorgica TaxID=135487 RepID=A0A5R8P7G3_9NOCA|nr:hypothetical protein FEK35_26395 [Nocardia cyriacigeorgica]